MRRALVLVSLLACGDDLKFAPEAGVPDVAPTPDVPICELDTTTDEANCGACDQPCAGGEVCKESACSCPNGVVPPFVFPTGFEQFFPLGGFTLALAPTLGIGGLNGLIFGFDTGLPLDTEIDLAAVPLGSTPFVASAVGLDIQGMSIDASYIATAGTIRFTTICETEIEGTLTDATFNGIGGGLLDGGIPTIDPDGCVVQVNSLAFHLATAPCTKQ
jgi:hypothetical protein